ncbi:MAG: acyl-CoA dehydrogenase family protein [[Clostridium] symbiosum]|uniref:Acyl-CoA dehydrogenase n=1 Tax=[Clostridium] symbiosum ATCC 14940 TaxID=411472 RepID=A0ABC9U320_CLOSY|nr:acyl-CoA dehydrogenase family protein [[Clostridium] symbiosum]ERI79959.1 putative acyl-CoA dehydrogenase [[Clostridium] symbiosum ATCC 14940]SUY63445.1 acyl-CoA dehydrogenase [[Clostridium] symbiosum]
MPHILSEENREIQEMAREFAEAKIRPVSKEYDLKGETPLSVYKEAAGLGYTSLCIPEEFGGAGLGTFANILVAEEFARADAGFSVAVQASTLAMKPILLAGTKEQKQYAADALINGGMGSFCLTEPDAGSDAGAIRTKAVKKDGEYIITGRKCFITNAPHADFYVVFAKTEPDAGTKGISAFLVERGREGLSIGKHEDKMGIRLSTTADVILEEVHVPEAHLLGAEGKGFKLAMQTLDRTRLECAAMAAGLSQRAIDLSVDYAKTRVTFGKPIAKLQAIQFMLADMEIRNQAARSLVYQCAAMIDSGAVDGKMNALAKTFSSEAAMQNTLDAVQIFSGYGYSREYEVEKLMRDAKIFMIFEGTNQIQRTVIAGHLIK